jgi:xylan 1,4-beta-xylosidase
LAGLTCFYNTENFFYAYLTREPDNNRKTLNLMECENNKFRMETEGVLIPEECTIIYIAAEANRDKLRFGYSLNKKEWHPLGGVLPADHLSDDYIEKSGLVFTGAMVGVCCQDLCDRTAYADFDYFDYKENHKDDHDIY